jgi:hypothetical protein
MEQVVPRQLLSRPCRIENRKREVPVQAKLKKAAPKKKIKKALPRRKIVARRQVLKRANATVSLKKKKIVRKPLPKPAYSKPVRAAVLPSSAVKGEPGKGPFSTASRASRFQAPASGPKYFFSTDIPDRYGDTYMRALPRDPVWIFAYWEISQSTINNLKTVLGETFHRASWVLRVSDITDIDYTGTNAWRTMDINITLSADNWYIKVWEHGRVYLIQCGLVTQDGVFSEAVRSNAVQMPNAGVSPITDEEWLTAESDELIRMSAFSLKRSIGASERLEESEIGAAEGEMPGLGQGSGSGAIL